MKKILSIIIAVLIFTSLTTSCGNTNNKKSANLHTMYFRDKSRSKEAVATFFNSASKKSEDITMKKIEDNNEASVFSCEGDTSAYNMVYITYDGISTEKFAFNKCVSGWNNSGDGLMPYAYGEKINYTYKYKDVTLKCNGYDKTVHIWTPGNYDKNSKDNYAVIYALDGDGMVYLGQPGTSVSGCENIPEQVKAMTAAAGFKAIVVAVETHGDGSTCYRDDELIPNLGKMAHEEGTSRKLGNKVADFISGTLVPYVQKNYNVYTDARHTAVTGVSLGGLEAFYIAMAHPETFGAAGCFSPSFWCYNDKNWTKFIKKTPLNNAPFIYIYTGNEKNDTGKEASAMVKRLKKTGYPKNRLAFHYNENGSHSTPYWRNTFSEFLEAMFYRKVEALM